MITEQHLKNWFTYHPTEPDQIEKYEEVRVAALDFASTILKLTPPCADQSAAIRHVRDAVACANMSIACRGT